MRLEDHQVTRGGGGDPEQRGLCWGHGVAITQGSQPVGTLRRRLKVDVSHGVDSIHRSKSGGLRGGVGAGVHPEHGGRRQRQHACCWRTPRDSTVSAPLRHRHHVGHLGVERALWERRALCA